MGIFPLLMLAGVACLQAFLLALTVIFAQAGADAAARDRQLSAHRLPVPSAWRQHANVEHSRGRATVRLRSPAVLPGSAWLLRISASSGSVPE